MPVFVLEVISVFQCSVALDGFPLWDRMTPGESCTQDMIQGFHCFMVMLHTVSINSKSIPLSLKLSSKHFTCKEVNS